MSSATDDALLSIADSGMPSVIDEEVSVDTLKPTYIVPDLFFALKGPSERNYGNFYFTCKLCWNKTISANYKSRANLRAHIKSKHSNLLENYDEVCRATDQRRKRYSESTPSSDLTMVSKKFKMEEGKRLSQKELDTHIVYYLCRSSFSFDHAEEEGFKGFMSSLTPHLRVKSATAYSQKAFDLFKSLKERLKEDLAKARKVCLAMDYWDIAEKGYIAVSAHWLSVHDYSMQQACIALRSIQGPCCTDAVASLMYSITAEFELTDKITHFVTDSGSSLLVTCPAYCLISCGNTTDEEHGQEVLNGGETDLGDILESSQSETDRPMPEHFKCAGRRLNLLATKDSAESINNPDFLSVYKSLISKLSNHFSGSQFHSGTIGSCLSSLFATASNCHWRPIICALGQVNDTLKSPDLQGEWQRLVGEYDCKPLVSEEMILLDEFLSVMQPLGSAVDVIQGDTNVEAGYLLPCLLTLQEEWVSLKNANLIYCSELADKLLEGLRRRFAQEFNSGFFKVATALHPEFKMAWVPEGEAETLKSLMKAVLEKYDVAPSPLTPHSAASPTDSDDALVSTNGHQKNKRESVDEKQKPFFWRLKCKTQPHAHTVYDVWLQWTTSDIDELPSRLQAAYVDYNTTLPSSHPTLKHLSVSSLLRSSKASPLSDADLEVQVLLAANKM